MISRGKGQSAIAAAAYRSGDRLFDEQAEEQKFYRARSERIVFTDIMAPKNAPEWAHDRNTLWNQAERAEKRKDAQLAREIEIALPHELTDQQREWLVKDFAREAFVRRGYAVDIAIHAPDKTSDDRNHHAHLMVTTRRLEASGFANSKESDTERAARREEGRTAKQDLAELREQWAVLANRHLERHGHAARIDHRSLSEQGLDREPTVHLGYAANEMAQRGMSSDRMDALKEILTRNTIRVELAQIGTDLESAYREYAQEVARERQAAERAAQTAAQQRALDQAERARKQQQALAETQRATVVSPTVVRTPSPISPPIPTKPVENQPARPAPAERPMPPAVKAPTPQPPPAREEIRQRAERTEPPPAAAPITAPPSKPQEMWQMKATLQHSNRVQPAQEVPRAAVVSPTPQRVASAMPPPAVPVKPVEKTPAQPVVAQQHLQPKAVPPPKPQEPPPIKAPPPNPERVPPGQMVAHAAAAGRQIARSSFRVADKATGAISSLSDFLTGLLSRPSPSPTQAKADMHALATDPDARKQHQLARRAEAQRRGLSEAAIDDIRRDIDAGRDLRASDVAALTRAHQEQILAKGDVYVRELIEASRKRGNDQGRERERD